MIFERLDTMTMSVYKVILLYFALFSSCGSRCQINYSTVAAKVVSVIEDEGFMFAGQAFNVGTSLKAGGELPQLICKTLKCASTATTVISLDQGPNDCIFGIKVQNGEFQLSFSLDCTIEHCEIRDMTKSAYAEQTNVLNLDSLVKRAVNVEKLRSLPTKELDSLVSWE